MFASTSSCLGRVLCAAVVCVSLVSLANATVTWSGDIDPANPATWSSTTTGCIGKADYSTGQVTVDGAGSTLQANGLYVGKDGNGTLNVSHGAAVSSSVAYLGYDFGKIYYPDGSDGFGPQAKGTVTVDGAGSTWNNSGLLYVGYQGKGTLNITNGGAVSSGSGWLAAHFSSQGMGGGYGKVTVDGDGSRLSFTSDLTIGHYPDLGGHLYITNSGLVSVAGTMTIYDHWSDVEMATGGMLALHGQAGGSLADFLNLITLQHRVRYWDESISNWADIAGATMGEDYWLDYHTEGDLSGYTVLTVGVPEPATLSLLALGGLALIRRRRPA